MVLIINLAVVVEKLIFHDEIVFAKTKNSLTFAISFEKGGVKSYFAQ